MHCSYTQWRKLRKKNDFLSQKLANFNLDNVWFQENYATGHTFREKISLLGKKFNSRLISKNAYLSVPRRSFDRTLRIMLGHWLAPINHELSMVPYSPRLFVLMHCETIIPVFPKSRNSHFSIISGIMKVAPLR